MGRALCCEKVGLKRGRWTREEDEILTKYIQAHGEGSWRSLPKNAGLLRCGKSCRLRWINYLRADLKRGNITPEEQLLIVQLHSTLGNRWSLIAGHLPGRTDNEIKNYWNSHLSRRSYSFHKMMASTTTGNNQPPSTAMNAATAVGGSRTPADVNATVKKKKNQTSRSCMTKETTLMSSSLERSNKSARPKTDVDDKQRNNLMMTGPSPDAPFTKDQLKGKRGHGSYVDNTGGSVSGVGGEMDDDAAKLSGLGPYEWLDSEMMRLDEFLRQGKNMDLDVGLQGLVELEREGEVPGLNNRMAMETETETVALVTASCGESNREWYNYGSNNYKNNNNNSSSSSVNAWFDWDWTSSVERSNQWDEGEMMLAWLCGSSSICSRNDEEASDNNSSSPKDTQVKKSRLGINLS